MDKELVFHIGDRKTGSTSIQAALRAGAIRGSRKISYPTTGVHHISLVKAILAPHDRQTLTRRFATLRAMIEASDAEIEVISGETFEDLSDGAMLRDALEEFPPEHLPRVRVIAYVRPHGDRLVSSWAEQSKLGDFSGTLEEFFEKTRKRERFVCHDRFMSWRRAFGARFELRPMIRDRLFRRDVVQDFARFVLGEEDFEILGEVAANESLSLEDLAVLRLLHEALAPLYAMLARRDRPRGKPGAGATIPVHKNRAALGRNLAITLSGLRRGGATKPAIHAGLVPRVQEAYSEDAAALDAAFFEDAPMSTALAALGEKAVPEPQVIDPGALLTPEELRLARALAEFVTRMAMAAPKDWVSYFSRERIGRVPELLAAGEQALPLRARKPLGKGRARAARKPS